MKDYEHQIIWLDYFNKNLTKKKGRRASKNDSLYDPTMDELLGAIKSLDLALPVENINDHARYPRRSFVKSGYLMLPKREKKRDLIKKIAKKMTEKRNKIKKNF